MVVQVVAEELNVRDRGVCDERIGEVAREQNEGHVANVVTGIEVWDMPDLERRFLARVEHLWCRLNLRSFTSINEFLTSRCKMIQ